MHQYEMEKNMKMFTKGLCAVLLSVTLILSSSGCAPMVIGALAVGAVGGYVVSPDTVEGTTARSLGEAWDAAKEIASIMGVVVDENERAGLIIANINGSRVTITLTTLNAASTKMSIKARKSFMPKIDLAQDVYTKVMKQMEQ
jgi:hypothetical protein